MVYQRIAIHTICTRPFLLPPLPRPPSRPCLRPPLSPPHRLLFRLHPQNATTSDGTHPKPRGGALSSWSEYLYLGTVATLEPPDLSSKSNGGGFMPPRYWKLGDSPELKPLPPLPVKRRRRRRTKRRKKKKKKKRKSLFFFFLPRGSSGNKLQTPSSLVAILAGTSSRSLKAFHLDRLECRSFTSRTPSYRRSNSLSNS